MFVLKVGRLAGLTKGLLDPDAGVSYTPIYLFSRARDSPEMAIQKKSSYSGQTRYVNDDVRTKSD